MNNRILLESMCCLGAAPKALRMKSISSLWTGTQGHIVTTDTTGEGYQGKNGGSDMFAPSVATTFFTHTTDILSHWVGYDG